LCVLVCGNAGVLVFCLCLYFGCELQRSLTCQNGLKTIQLYNYQPDRGGLM